MAVLPFFRRPKFSFTEDERDAGEEHSVSSDPFDELASLMSKDDPTLADLERIGDLLNGG